MADIIDPSDLQDELTEFDDVSNTQPDTNQAQSTADDEADIPEKFKGKSKKDIARAYEEAEKLASRHAQEVGELRKLTDQILKNQIEAQKQPEPQAQEPDFFDDPQSAVKRVVDHHPAVKEAQLIAAQLKAQKVKADLESKHGTLDSYAANPEFVEFVKASKVRQRLLAAAEQFDFDAADELLTTFNEIKGAKTAKAEQTTNDIKAARDKSLKSASVDMASGTGESTKKVYRRADLIRLMQTDPKRYEAMQSEIMRAYAEGRVK